MLVTKLGLLTCLTYAGVRCWSTLLPTSALKINIVYIALIHCAVALMLLRLSWSCFVECASIVVGTLRLNVQLACAAIILLCWDKFSFVCFVLVDCALCAIPCDMCCAVLCYVLVTKTIIVNSVSTILRYHCVTTAYSKYCLTQIKYNVKFCCPVSFYPQIKICNFIQILLHLHPDPLGTVFIITVVNCIWRSRRMRRDTYAWTAQITYMQASIK